MVDATVLFGGLLSIIVLVTGILSAMLWRFGAKADRDVCALRDRHDLDMARICAEQREMLRNLNERLERLSNQVASLDATITGATEAAAKMAEDYRREGKRT